MTVFVSSPSDVAKERKLCGAVVQELNTTLRVLVPHQDLQLELVRWETDTYPDLAGEPQAVVESQLPSDYDIFLGIMWARFGTPTSSAGSGTESEFRAARKGWESHGRPSHLMFYFCSKDYPAGVDARQLVKVQDFRDELMQLGLVGSYRDPRDFADILRKNLVHVISGFIPSDGDLSRSTGGSDVARVVPPEADRRIVLDELNREAKAYERIRQTMERSDERTRRMEIVASSMKAMSQSAWPLLRELQYSSSPGMRLAAVCTLEAIPTIDQVDWLADRLDPQTEKPFVGYHAAIALLTAARELSDDDLEHLGNAVQRAIALAQPDGRGSDRMVTLESARREVRRRQRLL